LFFNSLSAVEQQFLINAIRFEVSHLQSSIVKSNVIIQLNRVSNDLAKRVAEVIGIASPVPDPKFYNNNATKFISIFGHDLPTIATLNVAVLASVKSSGSMSQAAALTAAFKPAGVNVAVVGEILQSGIGTTYSATDASTFDGIIVCSGAEGVFINGTSSTYFPSNRPLQILVDGYRWGKPVGALGGASAALSKADIGSTPGVYGGNDVGAFVTAFKAGLKTFKFTDRFPIDK